MDIKSSLMAISHQKLAAIQSTRNQETQPAPISQCKIQFCNARLSNLRLQRLDHNSACSDLLEKRNASARGMQLFKLGNRRRRGLSEFERLEWFDL